MRTARFLAALGMTVGALAAPLGAQQPQQRAPVDSVREVLTDELVKSMRDGQFRRLDSATLEAVIEGMKAQRWGDALAALRAGLTRVGPAPSVATPAAPAAPAVVRNVGRTVQSTFLLTLAESGRDAEAAATARQWAADPSLSAGVLTTLGTLHARAGRVDEARQTFERALAAKAPDSLSARAGLGRLLDESGNRDAARAQYQRVVAAQEEGNRLNEAQWIAVGDAHRGLARTDPQRFRQALAAYDRAAAENPADAEPKLRAGNLFLERYNADEARRSFEAVLRANPRNAQALLGMAKIRDFDGGPGAVAIAESSLVANPRLADAHLFVAAAHLDAERYDSATAAIDRALAVDSASLDALSLLGAVRYLRGDSAGMAAVRARVLARDPKHAEFYATLAERAARHRQYAAAARFAAQGVALDPTSWRSHALRGINQLRLGFVDSARASLEVAFKGDPFDPWTKNTLDLLDAVRGYRTTRTAHFAVVADSTESTLLSLYLGDLLERGYGEFSKRYGYAPPPVRLEVYRTHADFSVRSVGLTGLGALGISFGPVLAMDAPSARDKGAFHWGATAWHELAHTFTLGVTNDRVPRWLSEGLSTLEERRARPGWGDPTTPAFLQAYDAGKVPPPSRLNDGFVRPAFPEQVIFSYYAASLVCEMIERDLGPNAIPALLSAYKDGLDTPAAIRRAWNMDLAALDTRFDSYVRQRFGDAFAAVRGGEEGSYKSRLDSASALSDSADAAIKILERAKASFPAFAIGDENAYAMLAELYAKKGDLKRAAAELTALTRQNASNLDAQLKLAALQAQLGDTASAAKALEEAIWVWPYDAALHTTLATYSARLGDKTAAVRERRAVLALAPVDVADARYQLAQALFDAGERAEAKREVLRALERAPSYAPAQELLLRLIEGTP